MKKIITITAMLFSLSMTIFSVEMVNLKKNIEKKPGRRMYWIVDENGHTYYGGYIYFFEYHKGMITRHGMKEVVVPPFEGIINKEDFLRFGRCSKELGLYGAFTLAGLCLGPLLAPGIVLYRNYKRLDALGLYNTTASRASQAAGIILTCFGGIWSGIFGVFGIISLVLIGLRQSAKKKILDRLNTVHLSSRDMELAPYAVSDHNTAKIGLSFSF